MVGDGSFQWAAGDGSVTIQHVANTRIEVRIGDDPPVDVALRPAWWSLPTEPRVESLAVLLRADVGLVGYDDHSRAREKLIEWAELDAGFAVAVVSGPAGSGKTRLGAELCRQLTVQHRWVAGLARRDAQLSQVEALARAPVGRCVVIDHADTQPDVGANLVDRLAHTASPENPVRVVLLTRAPVDGSPDVRTLLRGRSSLLDVHLDTAETVLLGAEEWKLKARQRLFAAAAVAFAQHLQGLAAPVPTGDELASDVYDQPLTIAMAAALGSSDPGAVPTRRDELFERLIELEGRHWERTATRTNIAIAVPKVLRAVAAYATLAGADTQDEAADLLANLPLFHDANAERRRQLADWMAETNPGPRFWNPIEPDLLGEHLVATTIGDDADLVAIALTNRPAASLQQPLQLIARAAPDHPGLAASATQALNEHFGQLVETARDNAESLPSHEMSVSSEATVLALALTAVDLDVDALKQASDKLIEPNPVFTTLQIAIGQQLVAKHRALAEADPAHVPGLATSLNNLSLRLGKLGQPEEALAAIEEATGHYRALAQSDPGTYLPHLATTVNNLSLRLGELERPDEALAASEEAVEIRRGLAETNPAAYLPNLAMSLHNLSADLDGMGQVEEGVAAIEEAAAHYRALAQISPADYLPDLALSLNNLSVDLGELGQKQAALGAIKEAVWIRRSLANTDPAYLPNLATSLRNLSLRLGELGRREEALTAIQEAVQIRRGLAETNPATYLPQIATTLNNLCLRLDDLGRHEEALAAIQEAVQIRRALAEANPATYLPHLATTLNNLSLRLHDLGRHPEALAAIQEAVDLALPTLEQDPVALADFGRTITDRYMEAAEATSTEPDAGRLERLTALLSAGVTSGNPA